MSATAPSSTVSSRGAGLLRRRDVRLLLAGQATSELGSQVGSIALPLVAVLGLGASPLQVGRSPRPRPTPVWSRHGRRPS